MGHLIVVSILSHSQALELTRNQTSGCASEGVSRLGQVGKLSRVGHPSYMSDILGWNKQENVS